MKHNENWWNTAYIVQEQFLNSIDIKSIFDSIDSFPITIYSLENAVEEYVKKNKIHIPDEIENDCFDVYDSYDFLRYLENRYKIQYKEINTINIDRME